MFDVYLLYIYIYIYVYIYGKGWKVHRQKSSYDDVISAVDDFLDQWDPNTEISNVEVSKGNYIEKWTSFDHISWECAG